MDKNMQNKQLKLLNKYRQENPYLLDETGFNKIVFDIMAPGTDFVYDEYLDFLLWCNGKPGRQDNFRNFLTTALFPHCPDCQSIMEIGCGKYARLSASLAYDGFTVTCVDPVLENKSSYNTIKYYSISFDYRDDFCLQLAASNDLVIGQEPCDATEHIIRACEITQTHYFVILCAVPHMRSDNIMPQSVWDWYDYLQACSPHGILQKTKIGGIHYYVMYCIDFNAKTVII